MNTMNTMKKDPERRGYVVTLENGATYRGVPCIGAYDNEREAMGEIFGGVTGDGKIIKGIFPEEAEKTGVLYYYGHDEDKSRYVFVKGEGTGMIFEYVFEK